MDFGRREDFQKFIDLIPGEKILDLRCGGGENAFYFKQKGIDVTCIDFSESMINLGREKGLNAFVMDIEDLRFDDNSFDGIWVVTSLLHIPKLRLPKVLNKLSVFLRDIRGHLYLS